jgi:VanZ family protein
LKLVLYWLPALSWMALIWVLSSSTPDTIERTTSRLPSFLTLPTVGHVVEFAVLAVLLLMLVQSNTRRRREAVWAASALLALLYAGVDEMHQSFVPGRQASLIDVGYDALGAAAGLVTWAILVPTVRRHLPVRGKKDR